MIKQEMIGIADEKLFEQLEACGFGDFPTISTRYPHIRQMADNRHATPTGEHQKRDFVTLPTVSIFVS